MSFRDDSKLDPSQVQDARGRGGVGRGGIAIGGGGLGIGVIIILLLVQALGGGGGLGDLSGLQEQTPGSAAANGDLQDCVTGADANTRQDCRIVGYVNSVQSFWTNEFARRGRSYEPAATYFDERSVADRLRRGDTDVGPFYCPADKRVYLDLGLLRRAARAASAPTAARSRRPTSIAHEYGHHVQDLLGTLDQQSNTTGARARPFASSCRPTASPACGPRTRPRPGC